jgi:hypothetical protein
MKWTIAMTFENFEYKRTLIKLALLYFFTFTGSSFWFTRLLTSINRIDELCHLQVLKPLSIEKK